MSGSSRYIKCLDSLFRNGSRCAPCWCAEHVPTKDKSYSTSHSWRWKVRFIPSRFLTLTGLRYNAYSNAAKEFTLSQAFLMNKSHAASEIDRILTDCITYVRTLQRPVSLINSSGRRDPCI